MSVVIEEVEGTSFVLVPAPSFSGPSTGELLTELASHFLSGRDLVLDFAEVEFIDSGGLGAILSCMRRLALAGGRLRLCNLLPQTRRMFEMARMHRLLDIDETRTDSLAALAKKG